MLGKALPMLVASWRATFASVCIDGALSDPPTHGGYSESWAFAFRLTGKCAFHYSPFAVVTVLERNAGFGCCASKQLVVLVP